MTGAGESAETQVERVPVPGSYLAPDGQRLAVRTWEPAGEPRGQVVVLHGIVSHGGWYLSIGAALARQGYWVHMPERRGSGVHLDSRGDVDRCATWLADVEGYLAALGEKRLPLVLAGISWGGKLAIAVARRCPQLLAGVALVCPGLFARQQAGPLGRLGIRLACGIGWRRLRLDVPLRDPELFTENADYLEYIRRDPLALRRVTARFALADLELNRLATESPQEIRLPVLLALAGRDRIVDEQRTREWFDRIPAPYRHLLKYEDAAHTLEFEPDPEPWFRDFGRWVEQVCAARFCGWNMDGQDGQDK